MSLKLSSQPCLCFSKVYIMSLIYLDAVETSSLLPCSSLLMRDVMLNALDNATIENIKSQLQIADTSIFNLVEEILSSQLEMSIKAFTISLIEVLNCKTLSFLSFHLILHNPIRVVRCCKCF